MEGVFPPRQGHMSGPLALGGMTATRTSGHRPSHDTGMISPTGSVLHPHLSVSKPPAPFLGTPVCTKSLATARRTQSPTNSATFARILERRGQNIINAAQNEGTPHLKNGKAEQMSR